MPRDQPPPLPDDYYTIDGEPCFLDKVVCHLCGKRSGDIIGPCIFTLDISFCYCCKSCEEKVNNILADIFGDNIRETKGLNPIEVKKLETYIWFYPDNESAFKRERDIIHSDKYRLYTDCVNALYLWAKPELKL